jgi:GT2 family glycosyltransferase
MVSIIIVTYNNQKEIRDCLSSIEKNCPDTQGKDYEVIVVDNLSQDKTRKIIRNEFPKVKLIEPDKNLGFGQGNNRGAKEARGDYLFFLNPDTIMVNNLPRIIADFFQKNPQAGALGPQQLDEKLKNRPESIAVDPSLPNLIRGIFPRNWNWDQEQEVDLVCGAALAVRKRIFEQIKGFDPDFFLYMEENDLCLRIREQGYKVFYNPQGKIIHLSGRSIKNNWKRKRLYYQSQNLFYQKHYSPLALLVMRIIRYPLKVINTRSL